MVIGGLTAGGNSRADVVLLHGTREARHTFLPLGWHDAAASRLGRAVYLFGGLGINGTSDQIVRVSLSGREPVQVGKLPRGVSSAGAATVGSSVFIVGGYNGKKASDEILAWRPGHRVRVAGRLPHPLRYPAVAALGRTIYIAGGTTPSGASHDVLAFDTVARTVKLAARLPRPTTHAAAAAFGCCVYVIGGEQQQMGVPTRRIFAIQPGRAHVRPAGHLPTPVSDLGAVSQRRRILTIGGHTTAGPVPTLVELRVRR
jgi:N-acetylneuraminic acid mutarotase